MYYQLYQYLSHCICSRPSSCRKSDYILIGSLILVARSIYMTPYSNPCIPRYVNFGRRDIMSVFSSEEGASILIAKCWIELMSFKSRSFAFVIAENCSAPFRLDSSCLPSMTWLVSTAIGILISSFVIAEDHITSVFSVQSCSF